MTHGTEKTYAPTNLYGAGGGGKSGGSLPVEAANTLQSNHIVKLVDVLCEGPIKGIQQVYLNETPLTATNGDNNFEGLDVQVQLGTPDQKHLDGFTSQEADTIIEAPVVKGSPILRTITDAQTDACRVVVQLPALFEYDDDGNMNPADVSYRVQYKPAGVVSWLDIPGSPFLWEQEKNTAPSYLSHRFNLTGEGPWDVRVVRLTDDSSDNTKLQNATVFFSIAEIIAQKISYRNTAVLGITANAQQFGDRIPTRAALVEGLICSVPSNFSPETRSFSGIWDGTFKQEWTDCPAWCLREIILNKRFGLGDYVRPEYLDSTTLYQISQYCAGLVDDGEGGQEHRFTFNAVIQTRQEAYDLVNAMASAFRGMIYWSLGAIMFSHDAPTEPFMSVVPANVKGGKFNYSGTSIKTVYNRVNVTYNNPDDFYRRDVVTVDDADHILQHGLRETNIVAFGCTSRGQATRAGRWMMFTARLESDVLTYTAGQDHADVVPGHVLRVMDPSVRGVDHGGRLAAYTDNTVTLDREVSLVAGRTYHIVLHDKERNMRTLAVSSAPGAHTTLSVDTTVMNPMTENPRETVWVLRHSEDTDVLYRVLGVREVGDHEYEVTALQHTPDKFTVIENGYEIPDYPQSLLPTGDLPLPENLVITEQVTQRSGTQPQITLVVSVTRNTDPRIRGISLEYRVKGQEWRTVDMRQNLTHTIDNVQVGKHQFRARSYDAAGGYSAYTNTINTRATGDPVFAAVPSVANVSATGAFQRIVVSWDNPDFAAFKEVAVFVHTADEVANATQVALTPAETITISNLPNNATRYVWLQVVAHGSPVRYSPLVPVGAATTNVIVSDDLADASITLSKLGSSAIQAIDDAANSASADVAQAEAAATASVAARNAAGVHEQNANTARGLAETALNSTTTARDDTQTARDLATAARDAAIAARQLSEGARDGSVSAKDLSEAAKLSAETARSGAESAKTSAASSATTATDAASAAESSATLSANNENASGQHAQSAATDAATATTKANEAAQSATVANTKSLEASTAAGNAQTSETAAAQAKQDAEGSATVATQQAVLSAEASDISVANGRAIFDEGFVDGADYWLPGYVHDRDALRNNTSTVLSYNEVTLAPDATYGQVLEANAYRNFSERTERPYVVGQLIEVTIASRVTVDPDPASGPHTHFVWIAGQLPNGDGHVSGTNIAATFTGQTVADGWVVKKAVFNPEQLRATANATMQTTVGWRILIGLNGHDTDTGGAVHQIGQIRVSDVTALEGAKAQAAAAASSATTAASKAAGSSQSAQAAQTAKLGADTAKSGAEVARDAAAVSKTGADSSAATAAAEAELSAQASTRSAATTAGNLTPNGSIADPDLWISHYGENDAEAHVTPNEMWVPDVDGQGTPGFHKQQAGICWNYAAQPITVYADRDYEFSVEYIRDGATGGNWFTWRSGATTNYSNKGMPTNVGTEWATSTVAVSGAELLSVYPNTPLSGLVRPGVALDHTSAVTAGTIKVRNFRLVDITDQLASAAAATAASTSASVATAKASEAAQSATAAETSKVSATTSAGQATVKAAEAASSASSATGSANAAATSESVVVQLEADRFADELDFTFANAPETWHVPAGVTVETATDPKTGGKELQAATRRDVYIRKFIPIDRSRRLRITGRFQQTQQGTGPRPRVYISLRQYGDQRQELPSQPDWSTGFVNPNYYTTSNELMPLTDEWVEFQADMEATNFRQDAFFFRVGALMNFGIASTDGALQRVSILRVEDVTDQYATQQSAAASSASANTAQLEASNAATSAVASETSKQQATTAAGTATAASSSSASSANDASTAESNAQAAQAASVAAKSAAEGEASAAATSASAALISKNDAGGSAAAANSAAVTAGIKAAQAGVSETQAAGFANTAAGAALSAEVSRDVTARLLSKGVSNNPTFTDWPGTYPTGYTGGPSGNATISKNTTAAKYVNAVDMSTGANPTSYHPWLDLRDTTAGNYALGSSDLDAVLVTMELELVSGAWGGACISGWWGNTGSGAFNHVLSDEGLPDTLGVIHKVEALIPKNTGFNGNASEVRVLFFATSDFGGAGYQENVIRVHSFDVSAVRANTVAGLVQKVDIGLNDIQTAAVGLRAKAGSGGALLELVAIADLNGNTASTARISADNILLDGSVQTNHLSVGYGANMVRNATLEQGLLYYSLTGSGAMLADTELKLRSAGSSFAFTTSPTLWLDQNSTATEGSARIYTALASRDGSATASAHPVRPGGWYMFSALLAPTGCDAEIAIFWREVDGTYISASTLIVPNTADDSTNPKNWQRNWVLGQAPANAAFCNGVMAKLGTSPGSSNSNLFAAEPMLEETHAQATGPSPFDAGGGTLISGDGIMTNAITAGSGIIGDLAVETLQIANNAVTVTEFGYNGATTTLNGNYQTVVATPTVARTSGFNTFLTSTVQINVETDPNSSGVFSMVLALRILRGTSVIYERTLYVPVATRFGTSSNPPPLSFSIVDGSTSGADTTYTAQLRGISGGVVRAQQNTLTAKQFKK